MSNGTKVQVEINIYIILSTPVLTLTRRVNFSDIDFLSIRGGYRNWNIVINCTSKKGGIVFSNIGWC